MNSNLRSARVLVNDIEAGILKENDEGYSFTYNSDYLSSSNKSISLTLPKSEKSFFSKILFPFFDGLIPEGWLLDIVVDNWKIDIRDRFGLLLVACKDCIGNVTIEEILE